MIKGTEEYLKGIVETHQCPEHGKRLVVAWHAKENCYVIRCGAGEYPEEVVRELSRTEEFKAGTLPAVDKTFNLLPKADLATGELLGPEQLTALVEYSKRYDLDALRAHVVLMYGKPYITIDGYLYHANRTGRPYTIASRPLTAGEIPLYQIPDAAHAWLATVSFPGVGNYFTGLGIVTQEEMTAKSTKDKTKLRSPVVAAHPWQLAQKRAEWQALRRAFPIGETEE